MDYRDPQGCRTKGQPGNLLGQLIRNSPALCIVGEFDGIGSSIKQVALANANLVEKPLFERVIRFRPAIPANVNHGLNAASHAAADQVRSMTDQRVFLRAQKRNCVSFNPRG